ncbi:hypothetical protein [Niabella hibiscisoli]|uniref:hypothetical protein n=1 Tax=Niabella hibiscisoli TaxID=1825928 RepID=UPI001F103106|nr:hypothetical protein [Niabella hibiscisoli]MCH5720288.1 hypothetical protein [Niabella hibiscisoli]
MGDSDKNLPAFNLKNIHPVNGAFLAGVLRSNLRNFGKNPEYQFCSGASSAVTVSGSNINGWLGTGAGTVLSGGSTYFSDNNETQTFSQSVTGVNLKGNGAIFTLVFTAFNGSNNDIEDGDRANFVISYGGTVYATLATTDGSGLTGTITFSNGATGSINGGAAALYQ